MNSLKDAKFVSVPLWFEVLSDARRLETIAPRSSLIAAYSALEIGLMTFLSDRIPSATYLLENIPSPPLYKLLRNGLVSLKLNAVPESFWASDSWKTACKSVQQMAELRNRLTHGGNPAYLNTHDVRKFLDLANELLFFLHYLSGNDWARNHLAGRFKIDFPEAVGTEMATWRTSLGMQNNMTI